jgi:hypothetical protein
VNAIQYGTVIRHPTRYYTGGWGIGDGDNGGDLNLPQEPPGFTTYTSDNLPQEPPGFTTYNSVSGGTCPGGPGCPGNVQSQNPLLQFLSNLSSSAQKAYGQTLQSQLQQQAIARQAGRSLPMPSLNLPGLTNPILLIGGAILAVVVLVSAMKK